MRGHRSGNGNGHRQGDLFGRDFMDCLVDYDNRITPLAANRQRQGLPVRSPRYDRRVAELRDSLKNEINRLFNADQKDIPAREDSGREAGLSQSQPLKEDEPPVVSLW